MQGVWHRNVFGRLYVTTVLTIIFFATSILQAQEAAPAPSLKVSVQFEELKKPGDLGTTKTLLARLLPSAPQIDGDLTEDTWARAGEIETLHPVGTRNAPPLNTQVYVGHFDNVLYIGAVCEEPDLKRRIGSSSGLWDQAVWRSDAIEVLLDSRHDRMNAYAVVVSPGGDVADYRAVNGARYLDWNSNCSAVARRTGAGWSVELAIPRASLEMPENDIIGFNVVRLRPGTEGAPFTWNPAPEAFEQGLWLGNLSFETPPCSIQKVEVGWPYLGMNRVRVWLRNETDKDVDVRVGLAGARTDGKVDRSRYQLTVPAGKVVAYGLSHRYGAYGNYNMAFALLPKTDDKPIAQFFRPGLMVASTSLRLDDVAPDETGENLIARFQILLPIQELEGVRMVATVRREGAYTTLGKRTVPALASRTGTVAFPITGLSAGTYQFDLYLSRRGKVIASNRMTFTLPLPPEPTQEPEDE